MKKSLIHKMYSDGSFPRNVLEEILMSRYFISSYKESESKRNIHYKFRHFFRINIKILWKEI